MKRVLRKVPFLLSSLSSRVQQSSLRHCSNDDTNIQLPEEPTNCCMSGCANCVWIDYAKELTRIYADGGSKAQKVVLEKISDPTLKVFLQMELKTLSKTNSE